YLLGALQNLAKFFQVSSLPNVPFVWKKNLILGLLNNIISQNSAISLCPNGSPYVPMHSTDFHKKAFFPLNKFSLNTLTSRN
ncbi:uncharacterized protein METZ01_LOCUS360858, partial [marine metagenome]